jgi:hypothetical protein
MIDHKRNSFEASSGIWLASQKWAVSRAGLTLLRTYPAVVLVDTDATILGCPLPKD